MTLFEVKYKVGGRKTRGWFLMTLDEIERHVGEFTVMQWMDIERRPELLDLEWQSDWRAAWAGRD